MRNLRFFASVFGMGCVLILAGHTSTAYATTTSAPFRSYLSSTGSDSNPCTLTQPCRLLPAALAATESGGEIWMLDSANYNTGVVTISQSVTILAVPGAVGSLVTNNANAVNIFGGTVNFRNIVFRQLTGAGYSGIVTAAVSGIALRVEDSRFIQIDYGIINKSVGQPLIVKNSVFDVATEGVLVQGYPNLNNGALPTAQIDQCTFEGGGMSSGTGVEVGYSQAVISRSNFTGLQEGIRIGPSGNISIQDNVFSFNGESVYWNILSEKTDLYTSYGGNTDSYAGTASFGPQTNAARF